jgi:hypothetical protein
VFKIFACKTQTDPVVTIYIVTIKCPEEIGATLWAICPVARDAFKGKGIAGAQPIGGKALCRLQTARLCNSSALPYSGALQPTACYVIYDSVPKEQIKK